MRGTEEWARFREGSKLLGVAAAQGTPGSRCCEGKAVGQSTRCVEAGIQGSALRVLSWLVMMCPCGEGNRERLGCQLPRAPLGVKQGTVAGLAGGGG